MPTSSLFQSLLIEDVSVLIYDHLLQDHTIELTRREDQNPTNALAESFPELKDEIWRWSVSKLRLLPVQTYGPYDSSTVFFCNIAHPGAGNILEYELHRLFSTKSLHLQLFVPKERDDVECYYMEGPLRNVFPTLETGLKYISNLEVIMASDYVGSRYDPGETDYVSAHIMQELEELNWGNVIARRGPVKWGCCWKCHILQLMCMGFDEGYQGMGLTLISLMPGPAQSARRYTENFDSHCGLRPCPRIAEEKPLSGNGMILVYLWSLRLILFLGVR